MTQEPQMDERDPGDDLARQVFRITMFGAALYIGVVFVWILL